MTNALILFKEVHGTLPRFTALNRAGMFVIMAALCTAGIAGVETWDPANKERQVRYDMIQLARKHNRIEIELTAHQMGKDLCVIITGGDTPHLGALTAASEHLDPKTIVFDTHKEYYVTEAAARILREEYDGNVVICCGIHLDDILKQEISEVLMLAEAMVRELCVKLKEED